MSYNTATIVLSNTSTVVLTFTEGDAVDLKQFVQNLIREGGAWDTASGTNFYPIGQWLSVTIS